jgi:hypothetical protein
LLQDWMVILGWKVEHTCQWIQSSSGLWKHFQWR